MASTRRKTTKSGAVYYEIRCRISRDRPELSMRWYPAANWSQKAIDRELTKVAAEFERQCQAGKVITRAEQRELDHQAELEAAKILTLKRYADEVYIPTKCLSCSENTRTSSTRLLRIHVFPALGEVKITEITSADLAKLLVSIQTKGMAYNSCVKIYSLLHDLFKTAYMTDVISINPMDKVMRPKPRKGERKREISACTADELRYILQCLKQEPLKWQALIWLLIDTGIRRGEGTGLQWKYVDFKNNQITVAANLCYTPEAGVYLTTPKNGKARIIDVDPVVMDLLRRLRQQQASHAISSYVFTQDDSPEPMHPDSPTRYLKKFSKRYDIPGLHPHKLRHSFASIAITNGADIASISEVLGHSNKAVTLQMYTHADQESMKRAGNVFRTAVKNA